MSIASLIYLIAPGLLFLLFFVKPVLGLPLALALLAMTAHAVRHRPPGPRPAKRWRPEPNTLPVVILAGAVLALMGFATGHYCWDWVKHWALLNSLEALPWPVHLDLQGQPNYLRFYVGAYLVPAGLAHLTGWGIVACTALWYGLGLVLAFRLLCGDTDGSGKWRALWIIPLLLCMAGADAWVQCLLRPEEAPITITGFHHESWAGALLRQPPQYGSMLSLLLWVPHQAIPAFISVGLLRRLKAPEDLRLTALAVSMLALWSPYALIGAMLLLMPHVLSQPALRQVLRRPTLATAATMLVASAFALLMAWTLVHELPAGGFCWDCAPARLAQPGPYVIFLAVELAIPLLLLRRRLLDDPTSCAAVLTLLVLPWIGGPVPDAVMRISVPALIYLFARCAHDIAQSPPRRFIPAVAVVLIIAGPTVWGEASFHIEGGARHRAMPARDRLADPPYTVWAQRTTYTAQEFFEICGWHWRPQYFASSPPPSWPSASSAPVR